MLQVVQKAWTTWSILLSIRRRHQIANLLDENPEHLGSRASSSPWLFRFTPDMVHPPQSEYSGLLLGELGEDAVGDLLGAAQLVGPSIVGGIVARVRLRVPFHTSVRVGYAGSSRASCCHWEVGAELLPPGTHSAT